MPNWFDWLFRSTPVNAEVSTTLEQISADAPIKESSQDLLERVTLAGRIADILSASGGREGRVFAIRGAWGFGKSSLKNLVIEALAKRVSDALVLEFNPWQWGDNDTIARALFTQMAGKLGGSQAPKAVKRAKTIRQYGAMLAGSSAPLNKFGHNATGIASLLSGAAVLAAVAGFTFPGIKASTVSVVILVLGRKLINGIPKPAFA